MKPDLENCTLNIQNGYNGQTEVYEDFFKYSVCTQEMILSDLILPVLNEFKSVRVYIGYKS